MPAWSSYDQIFGVPYSLIGTDNINRRLRRAVKGNAPKSRGLRKILRGLVNGAVGDAVSDTSRRIKAPDTDLASGGVRQIETLTNASGTLTTAQRDAFVLEIDGVDTPTFPVEKSGNSGGGKLGF